MSDRKVMIQWRVKPSGHPDQKHLRSCDRNWTKYTWAHPAAAQLLIDKRNANPALIGFEFRIQPSRKGKI